MTSLSAAVATAILHGNAYTDIKPEHWSRTYGDCGVEAVKAEWERQQWERTRKAQNSYEMEGK